MDVFENLFIQKYMDEAVNSLSVIFWDLPIPYLENFVKRQIAKRLRDQPAVIKNEYTSEEGDTSLLGIADWILREKPVVTPSGSFYQQHEKGVAPPNYMLIEFGDRRKKYKKEMFEFAKAGDDVNETLKDLAQGNEKIKMNSYYGSMGQKASFMYLVTCAAAITACGRNTISTTMWFIENFLTNNIYFDTLDEIFHYIGCIASEDTHIELFKYIEYVPENDEIIGYYLSKYCGNEDRKTVVAAIKMMVDTMNDKMKIKLFYKNNLFKLLERNPNIRNIFIDRIFIPKTDYLDPYNIPKEYAEPMELTWNIFKEFVIVRDYIAYDKITKFRERERSAVMYSDTDSVFIYIGQWIFRFIEWMTGKEESSILLSDLDRDRNTVFKIANVITWHINNGIHLVYDKMTGNSNVNGEWKKRISIKNEILMGRYIALNMQKNYIFRTDMQEGNIIDPPKFSVKGGNLNSKARNKQIVKTVQEIVKDVTMDHDRIEPERLLTRMLEFKDFIWKSIAGGNTEFLAPVKVKTVEEYGDNPYRQWSFKGVETYRIAENDSNITLPGAFFTCDIWIPNADALTAIRLDFPEQYERLMSIFTDHSLSKTLGKGGLKYVCIPQRLSKIPPWVMRYINIEDMVRKHINPLITLGPSIGIRMDVIKSQSYYSTVLTV